MAHGSRPVNDTIYQYMRSRFKHIARNSVKQVLAKYLPGAKEADACVGGLANGLPSGWLEAMLGAIEVALRNRGYSEEDAT